MPVYRCRVVDGRGRRAEFIREMISEESLLRELSKDNVYPISVRETSPEKEKRVRKGRIPKKSIIEFTQSLSHLLNSGFTLKDALEIEYTVFKRGKVNLMVHILKEKIKKGSSFFEALEGFGKNIPPIYRGLVRIGEKVGSLEKSFNGLSLYLGEAQKIREKFISAMLYPAIIISVALTGIVLMVTFALPKIRETFTQLGTELPQQIESMIGSFNTLIVGCGMLAAVLLLCFILFFILRTRDNRIAEKLDGFILKVPVLGELLLLRENMNLLFAMETLTASGFTVEDALFESSNVVKNRALRSGLIEARKRVMKGENLSTAFMENPVFSDRLSRWMEIGERSGNVEKSFQQLRQYYQEEIKKWSSRFINLIEPILILLVGVIILLFIIFFVIPIFSIYGNIGL